MSRRKNESFPFLVNKYLSSRQQVEPLRRRRRGVGRERARREPHLELEPERGGLGGGGQVFHLGAAGARGRHAHLVGARPPAGAVVDGQQPAHARTQEMSALDETSTKKKQHQFEL